MNRSKAFTLVELLIVIGLLGAIALIVISAINPIEQSNRARDTRFKADGSQLISALDRYFVSHDEFPWTTLTPATTTEMAYGFVSARTLGVGLCGNAGCTTDGGLLTSNELKTEFRNRDFVKNTASATTDKKLFIGKATLSSSSVYACFVPLSKSIRDKACADSKVYLVTASGTRTPQSCIATDTWVTAGDTTAWMICVPE